MDEIIKKLKLKRISAKSLCEVLVAINDLAYSKGIHQKMWELFKQRYKPEKKKIIETKKMYNKIAGFYGSEESRRRLHTIENKAIRGLLPKKGKILDAGCGTGRHSIKLARSGCEVVGIDLSKEMLKQAKKKSKGLNIKYKLGDLRKLPFEKNTFDHSVSMLVLNHLKDWKKAVKEIVRVTKPEGTIIISSIHPNRFEGKKTKEYLFSRLKEKLWIKDYRINLSELKKTTKCKLIESKQVSDKKFARRIGQKELDSPILLITKFRK